MTPAPSTMNTAAGCKQVGGGNGEQSLPDTAPGVYESNGGRSFSEWLQIGLALTLPLILFGVIAIAVFAWLASR